MDTSTALEASSSSSPSSSSTTTSSSSSPYDVFLSFSGEDTRKTFTDHLYWTMKDAGIDFFMEENESIRRGENISDKVKQIIEGSRVSVIVFSSRYADSIWCLEELVQIMECRRTLKQMVLPIFYDLSPSHGIGTFVQAFQKHRERFHEDTDIQEKIWRWTDALTEAAGLTVWVFETTNGYEGMFIREIIDEITRQLKSPTLVGIAFSELQRLHSPKLEDIDSTEHTDTASSGSSAKSSLSMSPLKKRCHEPDHSDSTSSKFPKRSISSAGLELANVLVTSPPLHQSWNAVLDQKQKLPPAADPNQKMALDISETKHSNTTIISFLTSPVTLHDQQAMVSFTPKNADFFLFEFLCGKNTPSFSVNELAINFFKLNLTNLDIWRKKLVESSKSSRIVITGHSFGGAVATLFTLWLLQSLDLSKAKRPLCITFGSPLIGDEQLRKCVLEFSTWSSCFLNVASINDPVPKVFLTSQGSGYKPFGTFLLCSSSGGSCIEEADAILQLLVETSSQCVQNPVPNSGTQLFDYGKILNDLKTKALFRDVFELVEEDRVPLNAGIKTQLAAILGVLSSQSLQQQQPHIKFESLIKKMVNHERKLEMQKMKDYSSFLKLNEVKKYMANMEWYKKESKDMEIGYYDRYRNKRYPSDVIAEEFTKKLSIYWLDTVTEAESKPQKEGATMRIRFLYGGTNYRRMIEPLHIAEYYREGGKNYQEKRPRHFVLLEQWFNEEEKKKKEKREGRRENPQQRSASKSNSKANSVASSLNDDSCFWVHVEEALILCDELASNPHAKQKLIEFERYVLDTLENFAVTPDIFLPQSSFMLWWNKYKEIVGSSYSTELTEVMKRHTYRSYADGVSVLAGL